MHAPSTVHYRCVAGCSSVYPIDEVVYRCKTCGELLEVAHDVEALKKTSGDAWKAHFDSRWRSARLADASGVWSKREWVMPWVRDENVVTVGEGASALQPLPRYGREHGVEHVLLKLCGNSHTGSFKDLGMTVLVSVVNQMVKDGKPIRAVACASTGDTSAALAAYCATAGLRSVVLLPKGKVTTAQLIQPLASGSLVLELDTDFDGCMAIVRELAEEPSIYLANSMNSLRLEGQKTVGIEVVQQLGWEMPDWFIIPGGNLGNVSALASGIEMLLELGLVTKRPRICVAQAAAANPLFLASKDGFANYAPVIAKPTEASAIRIGDPVSIRRAISALRRFDGVVEEASEHELANAAAHADRAGAYACPHTGVALAAFEKLAKRGQIRKTDRVVVISTASALKFTDFKVRYHEGRIADATSTLASRPITLPANVQAVRDAVAASL